MIQSEYVDYKKTEIHENLPDMNQITIWNVPYGKVKIKFVEDDQMKILLKVECSDGIVYILKTPPFKRPDGVIGGTIGGVSIEKTP